MTLERFRQIAAIAGSFLALIMFTGAAVRLTSSGLGCEDWPQCSDEQIIPELGFHEWIEFGNRLLSFAVTFAVGTLVWAARRLARSDPEFAARRLRRGPIPWGPVGWSWSIVAVVIGQIFLGGATVLVDLHPVFVSVHFLASIVTVTQAAIVWHLGVRPQAEARDQSPASAHPTVRGGDVLDSRASMASWACVGLGAIVLILGTIVTGTGPNSGDVRAERLQLDLEWTVRIHSVSAWLFVGSIIAAAVLTAKTGISPRTSQRLLVAAIIQGAIGYLQYANGVPPLLVELHVIGSVAVWFFALRHALSLTETDSQSAPSPAGEEIAPGVFSHDSEAPSATI